MYRRLWCFPGPTTHDVSRGKKSNDGLKSLDSHKTVHYYWPCVYLLLYKTSRNTTDQNIKSCMCLYFSGCWKTLVDESHVSTNHMSVWRRRFPGIRFSEVWSERKESVFRKTLGLESLDIYVQEAEMFLVFKFRMFEFLVSTKWHLNPLVSTKHFSRKWTDVSHIKYFQGIFYRLHLSKMHSLF